MHTDALANVYASSLYELARDAGGQAKIEEVNDELEQFVELSRSDKAFGRFISSPIIDRQDRREALERLFNGRITDLTLRFLLVLNQKGRLSALASIAEAYDHLVQRAFGRVEVDVFTAAPLASEALSAVRAGVHRALGKEPVLHPYTDPRMIGGIRLRVGDRLVDGSVSTRLRRMRSTLLSEGGARLREQIERLMDENEK